MSWRSSAHLDDMHFLEKSMIFKLTTDIYKFAPVLCVYGLLKWSLDSHTDTTVCAVLYFPGSVHIYYKYLSLVTLTSVSNQQQRMQTMKCFTSVHIYGGKLIEKVGLMKDHLISHFIFIMESYLCMLRSLQHNYTKNFTWWIWGFGKQGKNTRFSYSQSQVSHNYFEGKNTLQFKNILPYLPLSFLNRLFLNHFSLYTSIFKQYKLFS